MNEHRLLPRLQSRLADRILAERAIQPQPQRLDPRQARPISLSIADLRKCRSARSDREACDHPVLLRHRGLLHVAAPLKGLHLVISPG